MRNKLIQFTHRQKCFDGEIAEEKRSALPVFVIFMPPFGDDFVGNPGREVASIDESLVIFCPVCDFVTWFVLFSHGFLREKGVRNASYTLLRRKSQKSPCFFKV